MLSWWIREIVPGGTRVRLVNPHLCHFQLAGWDERCVRYDDGPECRISTVFLGVDHQHVPGGPPILWETMVFDANGRDWGCERYTSEADAIAGHGVALAWARENFGYRVARDRVASCDASDDDRRVVAEYLAWAAEGRTCRWGGAYTEFADDEVGP